MIQNPEKTYSYYLITISLTSNGILHVCKSQMRPSTAKKNLMVLYSNLLTTKAFASFHFIIHPPFLELTCTNIIAQPSSIFQNKLITHYLLSTLSSLFSILFMVN